MLRTSRLLAVLASLTALVGALAGCGGPGLAVADWRPAEVDAGGRGLYLADSYGRSDAVDDTRAILADEVRQDGWFRLYDRPENVARLQVNVLEWFTSVSQEARDGTDEYGEPVTVIVDVWSAHAYLEASLRDERGDVVMDGLEIEGIHSEDEGFEDGERAALDDAARDAVAHVLARITPTRGSVFVPFDARDEDEKPILEEADAHLDGALDLEARFIAAHPGRAAPLYNRAVMLEARGDYDAALAGYDDALAAHPDDTLYDMAIEAKAGCVDRRQNARALGL